MKLHRITLDNPYEALLPWRKFPGRLVSRHEISELAERAREAVGRGGAEDIEEILAFAESFAELFNGEIAASLLAVEITTEGEMLAMQPVPIVRNATGLYGVVQHDTLAALRSSLPKGRFNELRVLLSDWFLNTPGRLR